MVMRRCRKLLKDEELARDAMHEVFVRLLRFKDRLTDTYPSSLMYRMATNVCLDIIASNRGFEEVDDNDIIYRIACYQESEETVIMKNFLDYIFSKEKKSTRIMAVLHYVDGLTYEEVALEMGLSVSGVRKRLRVFKSKLKEGGVKWEI
jgi:RNA polymerase sigma-70 factor (ECF subfamily)